MKTPRKTTAGSVKHAWDRAKALGYESASTNQRNPYKPCTQCWTLFELGRSKAASLRSNK